MSYAALAPTIDRAAASAVVLAAARCWRAAKDNGRQVQPSLFAALSRFDCGILAPVFDSLMHLCQAALGRTLRVGHAVKVSEDEHLLLDLLEGAKGSRAKFVHDAKLGGTLDSALHSTRIMLGMTLGRFVTPEETSSRCVHAASPQAGVAEGSSVRVGGGVVETIA
ncbi:MAG: hypothetical protein WCZ66_11750 [Sphingomonadaceae bacterium]